MAVGISDLAHAAKKPGQGSRWGYVLVDPKRSYRNFRQGAGAHHQLPGGSDYLCAVNATRRLAATPDNRDLWPGIVQIWTNRPTAVQNHQVVAQGASPALRRLSGDIGLSLLPIGVLGRYRPPLNFPRPVARTSPSRMAGAGQRDVAARPWLPTGRRPPHWRVRH